MKNPMELYYEKTGKSVIDELTDIVTNNFKTKLTDKEKAQRLYELFCELHSDFMQKILITNKSGNDSEEDEWVRYRFKAKSVDDCRPLIFEPKYPWWKTGENEDSITIVAYIPQGESIFTYWNDAFDIDFTNEEKITFTDRFSKPDWFIES